MTRKRILISAYAFYPSVGGLEEQAYLLAQEWIKQGHQVDVLTEKHQINLPEKEVYQGINIHRIPYVARRTALDHFKIFYYLSKYALKNRRKYDLVVLRAALTLYPIIFGFWKKLGVIKCTTYVTADTGGDKDEIILLKKYPGHQLLVFFLKAHDYLNSICEANYHHYKELGFEEKKLTHIPNGIINRSIRPKPPSTINSFLFIARLFKYKGTRELLEAFKKYLSEYPDGKLFIAGWGPEELYIKEFIESNNLENNIIMVGIVSRDKKDAFFQKGDCLLLPSYSEGFPVTVLEAAMYNKAIIVTDVSDLKKKWGNIIHFCKKKNADDLCKTMLKVKRSYNSADIYYDKILTQYNIEFISKKILDLNTEK